MDYKNLTCYNCKTTCCDDFKLSFMRKNGKHVKYYIDDYDNKKIKIKDPAKFKVGDLLEVHGITIVKKKNGLWRCRAFNQKTRECMIYEYRPYMCRVFICRYFMGSRKNKIDKIKNHRHYTYLTYKTDYDLLLNRVFINIEKEIRGI